MITKQALVAWIYVLSLNRWLVEHRPDVQPEVEWTPVVDHNGDVR
jgi:hypothetical protein